MPDLIIMLERPDELVREFSMGRCTDPTTGVIYHPKVIPFFDHFLAPLGTFGRYLLIIILRGHHCK